MSELTNVATKDLRVGDRLLAHYYGPNGYRYRTDAWEVQAVQDKYVEIYSRGKLVRRETFNTNVLWTIERGSAAAAVTTVKSDLWNQSCRLCGAGIYVGFSKVEHDGPCQSRKK